MNGVVESLVRSCRKALDYSCNYKKYFYSQFEWETIIAEINLSQTFFGNPKGPVELGNPNTCAKTKLCLNFILFRLKK